MCRPQSGLGEWPRLLPVSAAWAPTSGGLIQEGKVSLRGSRPNPVPSAAGGPSSRDSEQRSRCCPSAPLGPGGCGAVSLAWVSDPGLMG